LPHAEEYSAICSRYPPRLPQHAKRIPWGGKELVIDRSLMGLLRRLDEEFIDGACASLSFGDSAFSFHDNP
jgi:hypothetical protein